MREFKSFGGRYSGNPYYGVFFSVCIEPGIIEALTCWHRRLQVGSLSFIVIDRNSSAIWFDLSTWDSVYLGLSGRVSCRAWVVKPSAEGAG